jgi:hypothetical protein
VRDAIPSFGPLGGKAPKAVFIQPDRHRSCPPSWLVWAALALITANRRSIPERHVLSDEASNLLAASLINAGKSVSGFSFTWLARISRILFGVDARAWRKLAYPAIFFPRS